MDTGASRTTGQPRLGRKRWNMYRYFEPEHIDHPSRLFEQLKWLAQAGFLDVDVYWMLAGHALFSGRKAD